MESKRDSVLDSEDSLITTEQLQAAVSDLISGLKYEDNVLHGAGLKMVVLPPALFHYISGAEDLQLQDNKLLELPASVCSLFQVKRILAHNNRIWKVPRGIGDLPSLTELDLSSNDLTYLTKGICSLPRLRKLRVENCKLRRLPELVGALSTLERLNVAGNKITDLPYTFTELVSLKEFVVDENKLGKLPRNFGHLRQLELFSASHNELSELPATFGELPKLRTLSLIRNKFKGLDPQLSNISSLRTLSLSANKLAKHFPHEFTGATPLIPFMYPPQEVLSEQERRQQEERKRRELEKQKEIEERKKAVGQISDKLDAQKEAIEGESLADIYRMDNFALRKEGEAESRVHTQGFQSRGTSKRKARDQLKQRLRAESLGSEFSDEEWVEGGKKQKFEIMEPPPLVALLQEASEKERCLPNLELISFQACGFHELPLTFGGFHHLRSLNLRSNMLTKLPDALFICPQLQVLIASGNRLESIPPSIGYAKELKQLVLEQNRLRTLPREVGKLRKLEYLELSLNNLVHLPSTIKNCRSLTIFRALNNQYFRFPRVFTAVKMPKTLTSVHCDRSSTIGVDEDVEDFVTSLPDFFLRQLSAQLSEDDPGRQWATRFCMNATESMVKSALPLWGERKSRVFVYSEHLAGYRDESQMRVE